MSNNIPQYVRSLINSIDDDASELLEFFNNFENIIEEDETDDLISTLETLMNNITTYQEKKGWI